MIDDKKQNIKIDITPDEKAELLSLLLKKYFNIDFKVKSYRCDYDFMIQIYKYYEKLGIEIEHYPKDLKNFILARLGYEQAYNFSVLEKYEENLSDVVISCFLSHYLENKFKHL